MTNSSSVSGAGSILANRYASSLIDVAMRSKQLDSVYKDMETLESVLLQSQDFSLLINNPVFGAVARLSAINEIAKRYACQPVTINFLSVLVGNRRLNILPSVIKEFYREIAKRNGEIEAFVKTAYPLTAVQEQSLAQELANKTGKTVRLFIEIDQGLLGGMVVTIGSQMIDDSIKSKLSRLKQAMISQSNQNTSLKEVG